MRHWYSLLAPPPYVPSNAMFARIWWAFAITYLALAVGAWLIWRRPLSLRRQRVAMNCWGWMLALGAAWPAAFFGLHALLPALLLAVALDGCAGLTLARFASLDRVAGLLLVPYFTAALFVTYLNAGFWWLNHY